MNSDMNKKLMWAIVIIVILIIGVLIYNAGKPEQPPGPEEETTPPSDTGYADLQTSDDTFNQIDDAIEFVE